MITKKITGEEPFQSLRDQFMVGPSSSGYTLAYSADGVTFTNYDTAVPANENLIANDVMPNAYYKLVGNTGEVTIILQ